MDRPYSISDFALPSRWESDSRPSVIERAGRSPSDDRTRTQEDREKHSDSGAPSGFDRSRTIYRGRDREHFCVPQKYEHSPMWASFASCQPTIWHGSDIKAIRLTWKPTLEICGSTG